MVMFPLGTLLRLFRAARRGSRIALLCLIAFAVGIAMVVVGAVVGVTALLVAGFVLCVAGFAGSRPSTGVI